MAIKVTKTNNAAKIDSQNYIAVIKAVSVETPQKPSPFNPDCDPFLKWMFRIYKPMRDGVEVDEQYEISYLTTMRLTSHPKNKLNNLLKALSVDIDDGQELDLESLVGKRVKVYVKDRETEQGTYSQIADVTPAPAGVSKPAPKAAPAPAAKPAAPKVATKPVVSKPAPVEEPEEEDAPPPEATEDDDLGDIDKWADLNS